MDDTRLFLAIGALEFVALEVSEYIKRLAVFGPSDRLEESIQGKQAARNFWHDWLYDNGPQHPEPGNAGTSTQPKSIRMEEIR